MQPHGKNSIMVRKQTVFMDIFMFDIKHGRIKNKIRFVKTRNHKL